MTVEYGLGIDLGTTFTAAPISTADSTEVFSLDSRAHRTSEGIAAGPYVRSSAHLARNPTPAMKRGHPAVAASRSMGLRIDIEGAGLPLVMVPGFACSPAVWFKVRNALAVSYELHLVTVPGFGGTAPIDPPISPSVRDALADYCASLGGAVLLGHSYGAFLSLWTAARRPGVVAGVIAVDGLPYFPTIFDIDATPGTMREYAEKERTAIVAGPPPGPDDEPTYFDEHVIDPADASYLNKSVLTADPTTAGHVRYEMLTTDTRPEMSRIRCPVHYLAAGLPWLERPEDPAELSVMREFYLRRLGAIADLDLVIAERARHFVMIDDPEFFLHQVDRFMTKL